MICAIQRWLSCRPSIGISRWGHWNPATVNRLSIQARVMTCCEHCHVPLIFPKWNPVRICAWSLMPGLLSKLNGTICMWKQPPKEQPFSASCRMTKARSTTSRASCLPPKGMRERAVRPDLPVAVAISTEMEKLKQQRVVIPVRRGCWPKTKSVRKTPIPVSRLNGSAPVSI